MLMCILICTFNGDLHRTKNMLQQHQLISVPRSSLYQFLHLKLCCFDDTGNKSCSLDILELESTLSTESWKLFISGFLFTSFDFFTVSTKFFPCVFIDKLSISWRFFLKNMFIGTCRITDSLME